MGIGSEAVAVKQRGQRKVLEDRGDRRSRGALNVIPRLLTALLARPRGPASRSAPAANSPNYDTLFFPGSNVVDAPPDGLCDDSVTRRVYV